jgi:hypothetical protein
MVTQRRVYSASGAEDNGLTALRAEKIFESSLSSLPCVPVPPRFTVL